MTEKALDDARLVGCGSVGRQQKSVVRRPSSVVMQAAVDMHLLIP